MKLEIATKQYSKANESKGAAQMISAARKAIDAGRPEWEKMLTAICAALIEDFGNEIADDLGAEKSMVPSEAKWTFDPMSAAVRAWIAKHAAENVKHILITNIDDVKRVIIAGVDENLSTAQIGRNLRQYYVDHSPFKAMRTARTETSHAAGFGQREAAKQSGVVKRRQFIPSRDDRVRDEHAAMDGEIADFNEPYSDGSMFPGENSINCRCVEGYLTR